MIATATPTGTAPCYEQTSGVCTWVYEQTGNEGLAQAAAWFVDIPLRILFVALIAIIVRFLVHRFINRVVASVVAGKTRRGFLKTVSSNQVLAAMNPLAEDRRRQRTEAVGSVLKSIASFVIAVIAFLIILSELGVDVGPALASAGIAGVALGFGAQNLVKDFLAGISMIFEDQYGVGDVIDTGEATGTVEGVGLRVTKLRDVNGMVWYVRNGEVTRIGNSSQGWARAIVDVAVGPRADVDAVRALLLDTAERLWNDPDWNPKILEQPEVWGVESVTAEAVTIRVTLKTIPGERSNVMRELRERVKATLEANGVDQPIPPRSVYLPVTPPMPAAPPDSPTSGS